MSISTETAGNLIPRHVLQQGVIETRALEPDGQKLKRATADPISQLAFSPDGKLLATGGRSIRLWDTASGQPRGTQEAQTDRLSRLTFAGHDYLVAVRAASRLEIWSVAGGFEPQHTLELPGSVIHDAAIIADGRVLVVHTTPDGRKLSLVDLHAAVPIADFELPAPVTAAMFTPDSPQLLALTSLGLMRLWNLSEGVLSAEVLVRFSAPVNYLGSSADGQWIATRMRDGRSVQIWDTTTGAAVGPALPIVLAHAAAFSPDRRLLAIASTRPLAGVELRAVPTGMLLHTLQGGYPLAFSPDGTYFACGAAAAGQSPAVTLFAAGQAAQSDVRGQASSPIAAANARQAGSLGILRGHSLPVTCVAISPDGQHLASGSADKTVRIWDIATGEAVAVLRQHGAAVNGLAFSPDGRWLVSGSGDPGCNTDNSVRVFALEISDGQLLARQWLHFTRHTHCVTSVDLSPDGTLAASTDTGGQLQVWDLAAGQVRHEIAHAAPVNDVAFSPDGKLLAAAVGGETDRGYWDADNSVRLWDVASGELYAVLKRHKDWVMRAVFSPDGRVAAAIDHRKRLYGWEIDSQRIVLDQAGSTAVALTSSDDLAAVAQAHSIQFMNPRTGSIIAELIGHEGRINQLVFSRDNTLLVSASDDATVRLWGVPQPGQNVTAPAVTSPAEAPGSQPTRYSLRLIELQCLRGQEQDGDEVYLRLDGHTLWDTARFGHKMSHHRAGPALFSHFNFRDCTHDTPQGRAAADPYRPDDFIIRGLTEPAVLQLWEADSFLRGGDDLLGEVTVEASSSRWDEVEFDFDRAGAFYRLRFAVITETLPWTN